MKIIHQYSDIQNKKVLFFAFDGTLITTASGFKYPRDLCDFRIKKQILDVISKLKTVEYIFIVCNQTGIDKTFFDIKFNTIISFIKSYLYQFKPNIVVKGLYCSAKGVGSKNRKPNTGMLERCLKNCDIQDKELMAMIGDASGIHSDTRDDLSDSDLRTARNFEIDYMDVDDFGKLNVKNC